MLRMLIGFILFFAWGLAVTFGVYVAANFGSKAHLNPAVTLGMAVGGYFPWDKVFTYIVAQFIGAFFWRIDSIHTLLCPL